MSDFSSMLSGSMGTMGLGLDAATFGDNATVGGPDPSSSSDSFQSQVALPKDLQAWAEKQAKGSKPLMEAFEFILQQGLMSMVRQSGQYNQDFVDAIRDSANQ